MRSHQVAVLLSTFATVALVAPAVQAGTLVTSLPIIFETTTGGFTPTGTFPDSTNGISADIENAGSGSTDPFVPSTGGAILANFVAANALGLFVYDSNDTSSVLQFDFLADGVSIFSGVLAQGINSISGPFNFDLSGLVPSNFAKALAIQFTQTGDAITSLTNVKLEITTNTHVPEPSSVVGLGLLGMGLAGAVTRRKLQEKSKTKV
jgi:hypothetical protein